MIEKVIISNNLVLSLWKDLFWYSITSSSLKNHQDALPVCQELQIN